MDAKKESRAEPQALDTSIILKIPPSGLKTRWFLLAVSSTVIPAVIIWNLFLSQEIRWIAIVAFVCWFGASVFPEIEIDLQRKSVVYRLKSFRKWTVFLRRRQISSSSKVQIHVQSYGASNGGIQGYVHKIACVEKRKRITLRDYERGEKLPDNEIAEFAKMLAAALGIR